MRIIIEKDGPNLAGDMFAISYLQRVLDKHQEESAWSKAILTLWRAYLETISNAALSWNYKGTPMPEDFNLPFEQDFHKEYKILGGTK